MEEVSGRAGVTGRAASCCGGDECGGSPPRRFGTFALVFAGTGAIVINDVSGGTVSHVGVAFTFGLIVLAMIYALGDVSVELCERYRGAVRSSVRNRRRRQHYC